MSPEMQQAIDDLIEQAYWRFDARHKGLAQWGRDAPMAERDAFKAEMRALSTRLVEENSRLCDENAQLRALLRRQP